MVMEKKPHIRIWNIRTCPYSRLYKTKKPSDSHPRNLKALNTIRTPHPPYRRKSENATRHFRDECEGQRLLAPGFHPARLPSRPHPRSVASEFLHATCFEASGIRLQRRNRVCFSQTSVCLPHILEFSRNKYGRQCFMMPRRSQGKIQKKNIPFAFRLVYNIGL